MRKTSQKTVEKCYLRLLRIKSAIEENPGLDMTALRRDLKGSGRTYTILNEEGIIKKINKEYYWNESIPVTRKLARSIIEMGKKKQAEYMERYNKRVKSPIKVKGEMVEAVIDQEYKANKEMIEATVGNKFRDEVPLSEQQWHHEVKPEPVVNHGPVCVEEEELPKVEFSVLWGVIKYRRN